MIAAITAIIGFVAGMAVATALLTPIILDSRKPRP